MRPSQFVDVHKEQPTQIDSTHNSVSPARSQELDSLQHHLGFRWDDVSLLDQALTHSSFLQHPRAQGNNNERLEFLGDAVLELVIAHYLYKRFPQFDEGGLSRIRSALVSKETLADRAREIELGKYLIVGKDQDHIKEQDATLADACEAVIGSLFLDKDLEHASKFILGIFLEKDNLLHQPREFKSLLQEYSQSTYGTLPRYTVTKETGPDHRKIFRIRVEVDGNIVAEGVGRSKKKAEKAAAQKAWEKLCGSSD